MLAMLALLRAAPLLPSPTLRAVAKVMQVRSALVRKGCARGRWIVVRMALSYLM